MEDGKGLMVDEEVEDAVDDAEAVDVPVDAALAEDVALAAADCVGTGEQAGAASAAQVQLPSAALLDNVVETPVLSAAQAKA